MTIDEKIQDFRQLEYDFEHSMCDTEDEKENLMKYQQEYEYYKQLAEWLEELKAYKEKEFDVLKQDGQLLYKQGVIDGYDKAIDDFIDTLEYDFGTDDEVVVGMYDLRKVAERLKESKEDED